MHGPACASDAARALAVESLELERVELSTIIMPVSLAAAASGSEGTGLRRFKFDSGAVRPGSDSGLQ